MINSRTVNCSETCLFYDLDRRCSAWTDKINIKQARDISTVTRDCNEIIQGAAKSSPLVFR